jgi:hypothetical protein
VSTELVYVLGTPGSNTVKIGTTANLRRRLADIQRMSPVPLEAFWTCPGGRDLETQLHRHFKGFRSHGEWFTFTSGDPVQLIQAAVETQPWVKKSPVSLDRNVSPAPKPRISKQDFAAMLEASLHPSEPEPGPSELEVAILAEVAELEKIDDTLARFHATRAFRAELAEAERDFIAAQRGAVAELKQSGLSWRQVGELLGVSGARAEQIAKAA